MDHSTNLNMGLYMQEINETLEEDGITNEIDKRAMIAALEFGRSSRTLSCMLEEMGREEFFKDENVRKALKLQLSCSEDISVVMRQCVKTRTIHFFNMCISFAAFVFMCIVYAIG